MIYTRSCVACTGCDLFAQMQHEGLISSGIVNRAGSLTMSDSPVLIIVKSRLVLVFFSFHEILLKGEHPRSDISIIDGNMSKITKRMVSPFSGFSFRTSRVQLNKYPSRASFIHNVTCFRYFALGEKWKPSFEWKSFFVVDNILIFNLTKLMMLISWN